MEFYIRSCSKYSSAEYILIYLFEDDPPGTQRRYVIEASSYKTARSKFIRKMLKDGFIFQPEFSF